MMRFVATVAAVFVADPSPSTFDIWENVMIVESDSRKQALEDAISISRSALDDPDNVRLLGYASKPVLYAVKWVYSEAELKQSPEPTCQILSKSISVSKEELERLRSFYDIQVPYGFMHVEEP